jgi:hypothetical protein
MLKFKREDLEAGASGSLGIVGLVLVMLAGVGAPVLILKAAVVLFAVAIFMRPLVKLVWLIR